MMHLWPLGAPALGLFLLAVNAWAVALYVWDKRRARIGGWRVAERTLLLVALLGGSPASLLAQRYLKHKTRKQPFQSAFRMIVALQVVGALVLGAMRFG